MYELQWCKIIAAHPIKAFAKKLDSINSFFVSFELSSKVPKISAQGTENVVSPFDTNLFGYGGRDSPDVSEAQTRDLIVLAHEYVWLFHVLLHGSMASARRLLTGPRDRDYLDRESLDRWRHDLWPLLRPRI